MQCTATRKYDAAVTLTSHHYTFRITSGEKTVDAESYSSYYSSLGYTAAVQEPSYYNAETPVFVGDTELTFSFYADSMRNVSKSAVEKELSNVVHTATETGLRFDDIRYTYSGYRWYVTLQLTSGMKLGTYSYNDNYSFTVLAADTVVLGSAHYEEGKLTISNCANLPEGTYTGALYSTADETYKKVSDVPLTRVDANTLSSAYVLDDGSYTLEIRADGVYLGVVSISVTADSDTPTGAVIRGYSLVYDKVEDSYYHEEIIYLTASQDICLDTYLSGYAYVRFSEDKSFEGVGYQPIRQYYDQKLRLSAGNGVKTIYVQFKQSSGAESAVYTWSCKKVDSLASPAIVSADILVGGTPSSRVPDNADFVLSLVSASQLNAVMARFVEADGYEYHEEFLLSYVEETEAGYLFQCPLNSNDWPFYYYDFTAVNFYLTNFAGHEEYDTTTLPIAFGDIGLYLDAWGDEYTAYTNQTTFPVTGTATPGATVTLTIDSSEHSAVADATTGAFSVTLSDLTEDTYYLSVKDSAGLSGSFRLVVDQTAPVINTMKAALADSGNAAVTWTYTEDNLKTFLLYRDDVLIKGSEGSHYGYTDTNYIASDASGATFTLIAVDNAGNRSEAKEVTVGDTEAPSAPGAPALASHGTKSIVFNWTAATDNVAVYQYEIWRDGVLLTTLPYTDTTYTDTGLTEGRAYSYALYALDRAGNKSLASETASLSTATLVISDSTEWVSEYLKEAYAETGVALQVKLDSSDLYHDLSKASVKLQYKTEAQTEWSDLALYADSPFLFARSWMIEKLKIGAYTVRFQVIDADGTEKTTAESTITINQDAVSPKVTITSPIAGSTMGGGKVQTVEVSATDNVNVTTVELYYTAAGTEETLFATLTNPSSYNTTYLVTEELTAAATLASGEVTLKAKAYALDALHVSIYDQEPFAKITVYDASSGETGTAGLCSAMMNAMKSFTSNVYLFSYDWRNDNTIAAQKLNDLITTIRADETIEEVVIVAHSMGGLVSSSYAAQFGTEAVTNIITVGTPYLGTPQGTYMLELLDNSETIIGGALSKLYAWAATKIITKGLGLEGIQDIIAGELIEPIIDTLAAPGMSEDVEELMNLLGINTLVQHYHGLYQLLPSPAYGGYMLNEMYGYVLGQEHERLVLNNMMEHYAVNGQHIDLITQAYQFHTKLGELDDQVLLNDEKSYFIVGSGQRTLSYLVPENSYSTSFENSFKDMTVESGDGTVTEVSSTMRGMIPDERSLYIAAEHTPLFSASNTINAIKDLLFDDEAAFGATNSFEPLEPYTKIKAECPVELTINRENESLISDPVNCTDRTSFGELYRLGSDADIKIAFVDDSSYDLTIFATDDGTMDLTIDYHTGGENDQVKTVQFTNVPLVAGGEITAQITPNDGDPSSDNGLTLSLDNDADGTVDVILQPGDASNDDKDDKDEKDDVTPSSPSSGKDANQEDKLPEIETNVGGNIEADRNGDLIITPDTGFVIDEILVNGKPVLIPADGILSGLKSSDHVQVTFAPANACSGGTACPSAKYTDVDITQWYHQSIDYVVANGLMNGTGANTFAPHATTSRGMIVTILWRLEGQPAAGACPFADVKAGSYYEQAIAWAAENGIVNGISATVFKPDSTITREQFATILYRYAKDYKGYDVSVGEDTNILSYADAFSISDYAFSALQWACGTGLMNGSGDALMPGDGATRAQAAAILYRFCTKIMN